MCKIYTPVGLTSENFYQIGGGARDEAARDTDATAVEEASVAERADGSAPARDDTAACHGLNLQGRPSRRRATILIYCTWGSGTAW